MTVFVEWDEHFEHYEVTQSGGLGVLITRNNRSAAISAARKYAERGEDIAVKGPLSSQFSKVS